MSSEAAVLDATYPVHTDKFEIPTFGSLGIASDSHSPADKCVYFCGNSLGLLPKSTRPALNAELDAWAARGVESHFNHPTKTSWVDIDLPLLELLAPVVGARKSEVAAMGSLTANLNALLVAFYKPAGRKTKILFEKSAFPSDYYAFLNIAKLHGYDETHLVQMQPRSGETHIRTEDIVRLIADRADELALVCFPGIQYYTGQLFDMARITACARQNNIVVGWDLAHAVGNVPLALHDWDVDFAAWCSYKYLNSGPGAIGGIFVHERHTAENSKASFAPRLAGWWGNNAADRFKMLEQFDPLKSALSYRQSNPSVIDCVALRSSLELFQQVGGVPALREKSVAMTDFMERLLRESPFCLAADASAETLGFKILTPAGSAQRGCQLSIMFQPSRAGTDNVMEHVFAHLHGHGIICDERRPEVIRLAPVPLYNTFQEVWEVVQRLNEALAGAK